MARLLVDILILLVPSILAYILARLGVDKLKLAEEAVLFAEDAFPNSPGVEKLGKAVEYLKMVAARAGIPISDKEAEEKARVPSQRIQRKTLETLLEKVLGR